MAAANLLKMAALNVLFAYQASDKTAGEEASIDEFPGWFPGVRREDAVAVLNHEANEVLAAGQS